MTAIVIRAVGRPNEELASPLDLHPCAEPVEIATTDGVVTLTAKTTPTGPGYHAHVCEVMDSLPVEWTHVEDETGYFRRRDRDALEDAFLDWLGAAAAQILELADDGAEGFALGLPPTHRFRHPGVCATLLGPRDREWLVKVRSDAREGTDVFPWWTPGEDAAYFERLALTRMWTDVRWRAPLSDEERALVDTVATWVERAHGLDPGRALPWSEQSELLTLLSEESLRATRAHMKADASGKRPSIGYRRQPVRAFLSGGWSIQIDGAMAERWDERDTWVAWDARRSVHFTSLTMADGSDAELQAPDADEVLAFEAGPVRGLATIAEHTRDGERMFRCEAQAVVGPHAAIGTLIYLDPDDREWALSTWGSLYRHGAGGSTDG